MTRKTLYFVLMRIIKNHSIPHYRLSLSVSNLSRSILIANRQLHNRKQYCQETQKRRSLTKRTIRIAYCSFVLDIISKITVSNAIVYNNTELKLITKNV